MHAKCIRCMHVAAGQGTWNALEVALQSLTMLRPQLPANPPRASDDNGHLPQSPNRTCTSAAV